MERKTAVVHAAISYRFRVEGDLFEAVGFLQPGEPHMVCEQVLDMLDIKGRVVGSSDLRHLWAHAFVGVPEALRAYRLLTGAPYSEQRNSDSYSCLETAGTLFEEFPVHETELLGPDVLVLRRVF